MPLRALPLAVLVIAASACGGEDPVATLERQKRELLEATVEKREFWAQVERKGAAARAARAVEDERVELEGRLAALEARNAGLEPALAEAREVNARAEEVEAEIRRREAELAAKIREAEATLGRWEAASAPEAPR
jgi:hypothetical protein